jgi:glutamine cyclotransferase
LQKHELDDNLFGEGITLLGNKIYQLSWVSQVGFIYDVNTFKELNRFYYQGEGWGITTDGNKLFRSDGSNKIYIHNAQDLQVISILEVCTDKQPLNRLNELEYIDGKIYANIWQSDEIAVIDPSNGRCEAIINFKGILSKNDRDENTDVLNGIAYDKAGDRLFITGKNWPKLFEVKIYPKLPG